MDNIQSNSQESLLKDRIRNLTDSYTYNDIVKYLDKLVSDNSINYEKLAEEILNSLNRSREVRNYYSYITTIAHNLVIKRYDEFKKEWKSCNFLSLHNAFKEIGMSGDDVDLLTIDFVEEHCLNEFPIELEDMIDTNREIVKYCLKQGVKTYKEFLDLLLKSKLLKRCNVPLEELQSRAKERNDEWNKMLECLA